MQFTGLLLGLIIIAVSLLISRKTPVTEEDTALPIFPTALAFLGTIFVLGLTIARFDTGGVQSPLLLACVLVGFVSLAGFCLARTTAVAPSAGVGLALVLTANSASNADHRLNLLVATVLGISAFLLRNRFLAVATIVAIGIATTISPQGISSSDFAPTTAELIAAVAGIILLIREQFARSVKLGILGDAMTGLLTGLMIYRLVATQTPTGSELPLCAAVGALGAVVISLFDFEKDFQLGALTAVIAIGVGTVAFGLGRVEGIGLASLTLTCVLVTLERWEALPSLGGLAAITLYHVYRVAHPERSEAFDIAQHYAVMGLVVGFMAPHLINFSKIKALTPKQIVGTAFGVVMVLLIPAATAAVIGAKGLAGLILGFGLASLRTPHPYALRVLSLGLTGAALTFVGFSWFTPMVELARDEKIRVFSGLGITLVILGSISWLMLRAEKSAEVTA